MSTTRSKVSEFYVIIPARLGSQRLPNKPLLKLAGKPLIQHIYENVFKSEAKQVSVATDSHEIADCVHGFGGEVCMTSERHNSGTDRVAEAAEQLNYAADSIIVNVQGDELFLAPDEIGRVAEALDSSGAEIATLAARLPKNRIGDPGIVKVVCNKDNMALYFSRAPIPHSVGKHDKLACRQHLGVYAYRRKYLDEFRCLPVALLEREESLEQLRALTYGHAIFVRDTLTEHYGGIDTLEDLIEAETRLG